MFKKANFPWHFLLLPLFFIISDELKMFYYLGLHEWGHLNGYLIDTCLAAQDNYKALLDYFKINY